MARHTAHVFSEHILTKSYAGKGAANLSLIAPRPYQLHKRTPSMRAFFASPHQRNGKSTTKAQQSAKVYINMLSFLEDNQ